MSLHDLPQGIRIMWYMRWCFIRLWTGFVVCRKIIKNTDIAWVLSCLESRQERHRKSGKGSFRTLLAFPTDVMLQFLLGFTLDNVVGMHMAQNYDVPNLAKKLEEIKKDLEAKKQPPSSWFPPGTALWTHQFHPGGPASFTATSKAAFLFGLSPWVLPQTQCGPKST